MNTNLIEETETEAEVTGFEAAPFRWTPGTRFSIPWDLGEWEKRELVRDWVVEEIERLEWDEPEVRRYIQAHPRAHPKMMLRVLTYAYLTGLFESEEIALACRQDTPLRALSGNSELTTFSIARFRRQNRPVLKWTLMRVMRRAIAAGLGCQPERMPVTFRRSVEASALERLNFARHLDQGFQGD